MFDKKKPSVEELEEQIRSMRNQEEKIPPQIPSKRLKLVDRHFRKSLLVVFFAVDSDQNDSDTVTINHLYYQGEKRTNYGKEFIRYNDAEYFIDYSMVIPKKKHWEYWANVNSAIDALGRHMKTQIPLEEKHEKVDNAIGTVPPTQSGKYHDTIVNEAYTKETGISKLMLMICIIGMCVTGGGLAIIAIQYMDVSTQLNHDQPLLKQYMDAYPPPVSKPAQGATTGSNSHSGAIIVNH